MKRYYLPTNVHDTNGRTVYIEREDKKWFHKMAKSDYFLCLCAVILTLSTLGFAHFVIIYLFIK